MLPLTNFISGALQSTAWPFFICGDSFRADLDALEEASIFSKCDLGVFNQIRSRNAWDTMSPPHSVLQPTRLLELLVAAHVGATAPDSFIRLMNLVLNIGRKASA